MYSQALLCQQYTILYYAQWSSR